MNIHLAKQATTTMNPVVMSNEMAERLPYGRKMKSSHIVTLQIRGLSKQARCIQILQKIKTVPLIPLGVLFDYGYTITQENQEILVKNRQQIIKRTRNNKI